MNYCRRCHSYYTDAETCACPPAARVPEAGSGSGDDPVSGQSPDPVKRPRVPYPSDTNAVETGLFD